MSLLDKFGDEVTHGDFVLSSYGGPGDGLGIFVITRTTNKMLKLRHINSKKSMKAARYPSSVVKLTEKQQKALTFKVLQESK